MKKVLAGGTFSFLHPGHIHFLREARTLGDFLIVVVASDRTVMKNKGVLLTPASERRKLVESICYVDKAVVGQDEDFFSVVEKERPDLIALGYDQDREWLDRALKKSGLKTKIIRTSELRGYSTTRILSKSRPR